MTNIAAMKLALDELLYVLNCIENDQLPLDGDEFHEAIAALRQAISEAEQANHIGEANEIIQAAQEPVGRHICNLWVDPITKDYVVDHCDHPTDELIPVYTAPPKAEQRSVSEQLEPVAWYSDKGGFNECGEGMPLYTAPLQREWVSLTDDEYDQAYAEAIASFKRHNSCVRGQQITECDDPNWHFYRAIEAKLKEKNT